MSKCPMAGDASVLWNIVKELRAVHATAVQLFARFGQKTKIVHFIGSVKPWQAVFNMETWHVESSGDTSEHRTELLQKWWCIFMQHVKPSLTVASVRSCSYLMSRKSCMLVENGRFCCLIPCAVWRVETPTGFSSIVQTLCTDRHTDCSFWGRSNINYYYDLYVLHYEYKVVTKDELINGQTFNH